jgi:hypothetical protein
MDYKKTNAPNNTITRDMNVLCGVWKMCTKQLKLSEKSQPN